MHRQRSNETLAGLRIRSFVFIVNILLLVAGIIVSIAGLITTSKIVLPIGLGMIVLWIISAVLFYMLSFRWKCPLCVGAVWSKTQCRRNKNARKLWGISYRLHVAVAVITGQPYRCPFCGERFSSVETRNGASKK